MKKRKKNKNLFTWLIGLFLLVLFTINIAYSFLNQNLSLQGKTSFSISATRDYSYTFIEENKWSDSGYYYYYNTASITYLESLTATSWQVNVWVPNNTEVTGCYNASSCEIKGNVLRIKNEAHNGTVFQNGVFTIGLILKMSEPTFTFTIMSINFYTGGDIVIIEPEPEEPSNEEIEGFTTSLATSSSWGNTTQYLLSISNQSTTNLKSWRIEIIFPVGTTVVNIWGSDYVLSGTTLILSGASWSSGINIASSIEIGLQIEIPNVTAPYQNIVSSFTGVNENDIDVVIAL